MGVDRKKIQELYVELDEGMRSRGLTAQHGELSLHVKEALVNELGLPHRPVDPTGDYPGIEPDYSDPRVKELSDLVNDVCRDLQ